MSSSSEEGWQNEADISIEISPEKPSIRSLKLQPNNLISESYPIEPDMLLGWRPKLPSGPVPLSYTNFRSDYILSKISDFSMYRLVFMGNRYINSVKVNQQYQYSWKERSKYRLNLRLLRQTVEVVGNNLNYSVRHKVQPCQYVFDSNFQSGNLDFVIQTKPSSFDCFVKSDTNTKGHCNWFYFSITNKTNLGCVKLNMCNLTKNAHLYRKGMKPYVSKDSFEWKQSANSINYTQKLCRYGYDTKNYQLEFQVQFDKQNQTIYVAYGIPYTFTKLEKFVKQISLKYPNYVTVDVLCESLGGLPLPLLTITDDTNYDRKQIILISARIHPGQSVSSFAIQGFIRNLLGFQNFRFLLQKYIFKVIPMMNPDGVVIGNFRTSYSGKDLNRQFNKLNKYIFPEVYSLDKLAKSLKKQYGSRFLYYFDFHGHSTKTNLFCYGPDHNKTGNYFMKCRAFAKITAQQDSMFSYKKSIFTISQGKKNTARAVMLRKIKIPMTFTFQLSNGLYEQKGSVISLGVPQMLRAGLCVLKGFLRYSEYIFQLKSIRHLRVKTKTNAQKQKQILTNMNQKTSCSTDKLNKRRPSLINKFISNPTIKFIEKVHGSELENIYSSIIKQQSQTKSVEEEGGSDSEDEAEDLDEVESNILFQNIYKREIKPGKSSSNNTLKIKEPKPPKYLFKSQKSQKQASIKEQQVKEFQAPVPKKSKNSIRSLTARIRRPNIPIPVVLPQPQTPIQKQVLLQRHFILNL